MFIHITQGKKDSKQKYLDVIEKIENIGFEVFDIGCYDIANKLSEAILIPKKDVEPKVETITTDEIHNKTFKDKVKTLIQKIHFRR